MRKRGSLVNVIVATILLAYALSFFLASFPHWPTYRLLWKNVLGNREPGIHLRARLGQRIVIKRWSYGRCGIRNMGWWMTSSERSKKGNMGQGNQHQSSTTNIG